MLAGGWASEERNKAIVNAQKKKNGGMDNRQTHDLIAIIKDANDFLCRTNRQHMLGGFDMDGLELDTGTSIGFAEPMPAQAVEVMPASIEKR